MPLKLETARSLTKLVRRLNRPSRAKALPRLLALSDPTRGAEPAQLLAGLPPGGALVIRHYDVTDRDRFIAASIRRARRAGRAVAVAGDLSAALRYGADGLHIPQWQLRQRPDLPRRFKAAGGAWVSTAVHDRAALTRAMGSAVDLIVISPMFPTWSHPGAPSLSRPLAGQLGARARAAGLSVIAMGGVTEHSDAHLLRTFHVSGLAGIGLFL